MSRKFQFDARAILTTVAIMAAGFATFPLFRIYAIVVPFVYLAIVSGCILFGVGRSPLWLGVVMLLAIPFASFTDVLSHGPYAQWHNNRLDAIARDAQLIGQPQSVVVHTFGEPTGVYRDDDDRISTYNYAPFAWFPGAQLQVHCSDGKVSSIELLDD